jgi:hypothetical protein
MYAAAPVNAFYLLEVNIVDGESEITIAVSEKLFLSTRAVYGSVYFKIPDEAAFFPADSLKSEYFELTTSLTTYLTRSVSEGQLRSVEKVVNTLNPNLSPNQLFMMALAMRLTTAMVFLCVAECC